jgi:hypothetical protein
MSRSAATGPTVCKCAFGYRTGRLGAHAARAMPRASTSSEQLLLLVIWTSSPSISRFTGDREIRLGSSSVFDDWGAETIHISRLPASLMG